MKDTWSLDILYKGYDDTFQKDIKAFGETLGEKFDRENIKNPFALK